MNVFVRFHCQVLATVSLCPSSRSNAAGPYVYDEAGIGNERINQLLDNAVAPGPILPPEEMSDQTRQEVERQTPLGRWGGAAEIAKTVLFLVETDFVTGECIRVDGGRHLK